MDGEMRSEAWSTCSKPKSSVRSKASNLRSASSVVPEKRKWSVRSIQRAEPTGRTLNKQRLGSS